MESTEKSKFEVIITDPGDSYFYEVLEYLYDNYPIDRAEEIANELRDTTKELHYQPERGTPEPQLVHRSKGYRYILYKRTARAEIKVIYYIDASSGVVYVTDFFPTEKDNAQIAKRNV